MRINTEQLFNDEKTKHLQNLESIRSFIFGDENNQPQVTYVPNMMKFEHLYKEIKAWIETSQFEDEE